MISQENKNFLPTDFVITNWENLEPYFKNLEEREILSVAELRRWMRDRSELESILEEDLGWRYIKMTCDTTDENLEKSYIYFVSEIEPKVSPISNQLNLKLFRSPYFNEIKNEKNFTYTRSLEKDIEIFREENIPLFTKLQTLQQKYGQVCGAMTVEIEGKTLTLQQASNFLQNTEREIRKEAFEKINNRRFEDIKILDELFNTLIALRNKVALNAGFSNFRDYMFAALGRFDYTKEDCFAFHDAIKKQVVPLIKSLHEKRKCIMNIDVLKPYDMDVDPLNRPPLKPFTDGKDLLDKTIKCFENLDPFFKECILTMIDKKHFDVESRIGKAPGGYNYPLAVSGFPFIFMNSSGNTRDVETMVHEAGHAFHSILTKDLEYNFQKNFPSEVAELASMSMELISAEAQKIFYTNEEDHKRSLQIHLEGIIYILPWIAMVDKFQHWIYTNIGHTAEERCAAWNSINEEYATGIVDYSGYENFKKYSWQKQLHIFEVPFYYIEYGIAQLGAIGVWKNYLENNSAGLQKYKNALSLGYTATMPEIYNTAGVKFNFSDEYLKELVEFLKQKIN